MREPLSKNGLALIQIPQPVKDSYVSLLTILGHSSGQFITATFGINMVKSTPQELGLVITYLRRYASCSIVGVAQADNDADDQRFITEKQADQLVELADELFGKEANAQLARVSKLFNVKDVSGILSGNFDAAINNLNQISKSAEKKAAEKKAVPKVDKTDAVPDDTEDGSL